MVMSCRFRIPLGRPGRENSDLEVEAARLDFVKPIIDALRGVLPKDLHIPQIELMGTYLILAVVKRDKNSTITPIQIDLMVREIIDCIKYAAEAIRANSHESKPKPLDKVAGLVAATKRLLRALKDGGRVKMQVDYLNGSVTIGLPMPDAADFTDLIVARAEKRNIDHEICGYFSTGDDGKHMILISDRTFIRIPQELSEVCEMALQRSRLLALVSRRSGKEDWAVDDNFHVPDDLFAQRA